MLSLVAGRDFVADGTAEVAEVRAGDPAPDGSGPVELARGTEIGHVFALGRKYAGALGLQVLDRNGKLVTVTMGSYGIGISRDLALVAEANSDEKGLAWPRAVAPFDALIVAAGKDEALFEEAERIGRELELRGADVLVDDRRLSPGVKFKDAELIGVPTVVVVGRGLADGVVEVWDRAADTRAEVPADDRRRRGRRRHRGLIGAHPADRLGRRGRGRGARDRDHARPAHRAGPQPSCTPSPGATTTPTACATASPTASMKRASARRHDLDGTLLRSDGTVSPRTAALAELDRRGVPVVFVTARPIHWVTDLAPHVGRRGWVVCSNGAVLLDLPRDEVVVARTMSALHLRNAVSAIRAAAPDATFALVGLHGYAKEPGYVERTGMPPGSAVGPIETLIRDDEVLKLLVRGPLPPEAFRALVTEAVSHGEVTASDGSGVIEISAPGVSKATTLALVCERFGVDAADVVAFGDMPNDVPMLRWSAAYAVEAHLRRRGDRGPPGG